MFSTLSRIRPSGKTLLKVVAGAVASVTIMLLPCETENAVANGDTRTIQLHHAHTKESITATFLVNGSYDQGVLDKLNWFLRDWRRDEPTKMDPKLFDVIWEVYRESGSQQPIEVMSAYRSPETNAMLRRRSRAVAEHSQHILGKAMDQHYMDVPMSRIREIAMRLQRGGVGFYPTAGTPFVHMDVGGVRHWPRMSYDQLARLFPDGKTVHIPSNGQPLPGYELARAELEAGGGESYPTASAIKSKGFFAWLFGSGDDEEDAAEGGVRRATASRNQRVAMVDRSGGQVAQYDTTSKDGGMRSFFASQQSGNAPPSTPYGRVAREAPAPVPQQPPPPASVLAQAVPEPAPAEAPVQPAISPAEPAETDATRAVAQLSVQSQTLMSNGLTVPMPPRKPSEFADLGVNLPLPPARPAELSRPIEAAAPTPSTTRQGKADAIKTLLLNTKTAGLQPLIAQGSGSGRSAMNPAMAYAAGSTLGGVPLPVARPADLVQARLDRSNFRNLTSAARTEKTTTRAVLGSTIIGVRAASRANAGTMAANSSSSTRFGSKASDLTTDRFSGQAVKPAERLVPVRRAEATAPSRARDD